MKKVVIYSDGSCLGNPGPGGWATILTFGAHEKMLSGGKLKTTNNNMELTGVLEGLKALKQKCEVEIISDSKYVTDAFNQKWVYNWERYDYNGRPNAELWRELVPLTRVHNVTFTWIKGHAGHPYNERCDAEAVRQSKYFENKMLQEQREAAMRKRSQIDKSFNEHMMKEVKDLQKDIYPWAYDGPLY